MDRKAIIDKIVKEALYYFDKGRIYRPTRQELDGQTYFCPRCRRPLIKTRFQMATPIFFCKKCKFMIEQSNILDSEERIRKHLDGKNNIDIEVEEGDVIIANANDRKKASEWWSSLSINEMKKLQAEHPFYKNFDFEYITENKNGDYEMYKYFVLKDKNWKNNG